MGKVTFGVIAGNRGFFPDILAKEGCKHILDVPKRTTPRVKAKESQAALSTWGSKAGFGPNRGGSLHTERLSYQWLDLDAIPLMRQMNELIRRGGQMALLGYDVGSSSVKATLMDARTVKAHGSDRAPDMRECGCVCQRCTSEASSFPVLATPPEGASWTPASKVGYEPLLRSPRGNGLTGRPRQSSMTNANAPNCVMVIACLTLTIVAPHVTSSKLLPTIGTWPDKQDSSAESQPQDATLQAGLHFEKIAIFLLSVLGLLDLIEFVGERAISTVERMRRSLGRLKKRTGRSRRKPRRHGIGRSYR